MAKVFIITSFKNGKLYSNLRDILVHNGHTLSHDWYKFCCQQKQTDARIVCTNTCKDVEGIKAADVVVLLTPCGNDSFVELGAAIASDKPVLVALPSAHPVPGCSYFNAPSVHTSSYRCVEDIYGALHGVLQQHIARIRND